MLKRKPPKKNRIFKIVQTRAFVPSLQQKLEKVILRGCLQHNHELEVQFQCLQQPLKQDTARLLTDGVTPSAILQKHYREKRYSFGGDMLRPVMKKDIDNIRQIIPPFPSINPQLSEKENFLTGLASDSVVAFNFPHILPDVPEALCHKVLDTDGSDFLMVMTSGQRELFSQFSKRLFIDSTHDTNRSGYLLLFGLVLNSRQEGTLVFQCICKEETVQSLP